MQLSQNESEESKLSSTYIDCNRTIKLSFKNTESLTINVVFMEQSGIFHPDTGEEIQYPLAMVYIGYIDKPLIQHIIMMKITKNNQIKNQEYII